MKKEYTKPQIEMVAINQSDIITTSAEVGDLTGIEGLISNDGTGWSEFY